MRIPDYPSNRDADEGTNATAHRREGVPEEEAKSGDLFTRECSWDGAKLCGTLYRLFDGSSRRGRAFFCLRCLFEYF